MSHNPTRYYSRSEKLVAALIAQGRGVGLKQLVADNNNRTIAGLHVTSQRPCWWSRTKAFLSSGN